MTKIKLLKNHTHYGVQYQAGDVIEVNPIDAQFLTQQKIGVKQQSKKEEKVNE
ncbi:hypothetical protein ROV36_10665 [Pasteurella multocida]|uniref:DUF7210 family protein n=1 Tax=Pasteurella multocida TaxID=747 RepID=UPI002C19D44A|nr:hypothetical protein [Pasteurella multocida]MEB3452047.1 hypothetical protein [Pasteurella multocida]MEB3460474.1 hypothetical protein [Pasteurella multocida]MEB3462675.1 hypothetical protein [Pasteurella multocida]